MNLYNDEALIKAVTYSISGGHCIRLELDPEGWEALKGMDGSRVRLAMVLISNDQLPA